MRWALEIPGSSDALAEIEGDPRLVRVAKRSKTLSNKPVVEIAHQVWTNDCGVAPYEPFVVVDSLTLRKLTGEIWLAAAAGIAGVISHGSQ